MGFSNIFWLAFSVLMWGFFHSLFASLPFKAFIRHHLGSLSDRYYRLAYNIFAGISFVGILVIAALTPDRTLYVVPFPWVAFLIIAEFLAVAALVVGLRQTDALQFLGLRQIIGPRTPSQNKLVTDGLYRYVRHPLYTAGLAFIWLMPLMTARLLVINLALTLYIVVGAFIEERKLRHKFGHDYVAYIAATPMFIPFIKKIHDRLIL